MLTQLDAGEPESLGIYGTASRPELLYAFFVCMPGTALFEATCADPGWLAGCMCALQIAGGRQPVGLAHCSSLKAYQAFQSAGSLGSSTVGSSQPCLLKSISSGPSMSVSGLNISTDALELRANAALRKCGSNKQ